jgi:mRNA-degrading endonuclease RelE of RelBE toxin-antitoxin system
VNVTFVESTKFSKEREHIFGGDDEFRVFQEKLMQNPDCGAPVPKCPHVRKVRFRAVSQAKGSRGGIRVLYRHVPEESRIYLLKAYVKNELENPSADEMKEIRQMAANEVDTEQVKP